MKKLETKHPRSKPEHNVDGLLELELRDFRIAERGHTRNFRKRHMKELSSDTRAEIVKQYVEDNLH